MTAPQTCNAVPEHDPFYIRNGRCILCYPAAQTTPAGARPVDPFMAHEQPRTGKATAAAVLLIVIGGLAVLGTLALLSAGFVVGVLLVVLLFGGFEIWVGVALLLRQSWAHTAGRVVGIIGIVLAGFSVLSGNGASIVGLGVYIALVALLFGDRALNR